MPRACRAEDTRRLKAREDCGMRMFCKAVAKWQLTNEHYSNDYCGAPCDDRMCSNVDEVVTAAIRRLGHGKLDFCPSGRLLARHVIGQLLMCCRRDEEQTAPWGGPT